MLRCNAACYEDVRGHYGGNKNVIMAISFFGPATATKAFSAFLQTEGSHCARVTLHEDIDDRDSLGDFTGYESMVRHENGYSIQRRKSLMDNYHSVAIARDHRFLVDTSEDCLWLALKSPAFTTPILRHWMPWLMGQLQARMSSGYYGKRLLNSLKNFQMNASVLTLYPEQLDALVSEGVRDGHLTMKAK